MTEHYVMRANYSQKYSQAIADFCQSGLCHIGSFFSKEEIDSLAVECERLGKIRVEKSFKNLRTGLRINLYGEPVIDRIDPVIDISPVFNELSKDQRLSRLVENLMQQPAQVMKEKLIYKAPGTSGFGLHRDEPYYRVVGATGSEIISVTIAIDQMRADNGPIMFYPQLRLRPTRAAVTEARDIADEEINGLTPQTYLMKPGDIVIFDGLVPHRSDFNRSDRQRRTYTVTYVPARLKNARRRYYSQRLREQEHERQPIVGGQCTFN